MTDSIQTKANALIKELESHRSETGDVYEDAALVVYAVTEVLKNSVSRYDRAKSHAFLIQTIMNFQEATR